MENKYKQTINRAKRKDYKYVLSKNESEEAIIIGV